MKSCDVFITHFSALDLVPGPGLDLEKGYRKKAFMSLSFGLALFSLETDYSIHIFMSLETQRQENLLAFSFSLVFFTLCITIY